MAVKEREKRIKSKKAKKSSTKSKTLTKFRRDDLVPNKEACKILKMTPPALVRHVKAGSLRAYKDPFDNTKRPTLYYHKSDLKKFIDEQANPVMVPYTPPIVDVEEVAEVSAEDNGDEDKDMSLEEMADN